jgi:hypothetical protein
MDELNDRPDEGLSALFERASHPLDAESFLEQLEQRLRAARRRAQLKRAAGTLLGTALIATMALFATPYVSELCVSLGTLVQSGVPRLGDALASPAGWGLSIVLAALLLLRSGVLRR